MRASRHAPALRAGSPTTSLASAVAKRRGGVKIGRAVPRLEVRLLLTGLGRLPIAPADPMTFEYIPVLAMIVLSALVPGLFLAVSVLFGPRRPSAVEGGAFAGGQPSRRPPPGRFSGQVLPPPHPVLLFCRP